MRAGKIHEPRNMSRLRDCTSLKRESENEADTPAWTWTIRKLYCASAFFRDIFIIDAGESRGVAYIDRVTRGASGWADCTGVIRIYTITSMAKAAGPSCQRAGSGRVRKKAISGENATKIEDLGAAHGAAENRFGKMERKKEENVIESKRGMGSIGESLLLCSASGAASNR